MKKLILILAVLLAVTANVSAQSVTCSASGQTAFQSAQYAKLLATVNADRAARGLPTYANFTAHCQGMMLDAFQAWVSTQTAVDADKVKAAIVSNGQDVATNAQCAAVSLANGCTKSAVACVMLKGNADCN